MLYINRIKLEASVPLVCYLLVFITAARTFNSVFSVSTFQWYVVLRACVCFSIIKLQESV